MTDVDALLREAQALRDAGNLTQAERICRRALEQAPDNGQVRYALGCLLAQAGDAEQALRELETASRLMPEFAGPPMALGELLLMAGRYGEAVSPLTRAAEIAPGFTPCRINLALALAFSGRMAESEALFTAIVAADPANAEARSSFACALNAWNRFAEAEAQAGVAVELAPDSAAAWQYLANALVRLGRWDEAEPVLLRTIERIPDALQPRMELIEVYRRGKRYVEAERAARSALKLRPNDAAPLCALGAALIDLGRWSEAIETLTRALVIRPDLLPARFQLGVALSNSDRFAEAEAQFRRSIEGQSDNAEAHCYLAYSVNAQRRYEEGEAEARIAIDLAPEYDLAMNVLGVSLHGIGRAAEAAEWFQRALEISPSNLTYLYWLWTALLLAGDYARGFPAYDRWKRESRFKHREFPRPRWDGEPIPGGRLLVYSDHGFGDAFQMLRFLPDAKRRSQANIVFEGQPELLPLVANNPSVSAVVPQRADEQPPQADYDAVIGLTGLPGIFCLSVEDLPRSVPYIVANPERVAAWRDRLEQWPGFRIGICWTGDAKNPTNVFRSCRLADFARIAAVPGTRLFSLQVGFGSEQAPHPPNGLSLVDLGPYLTDFGETAAALTNLDLIISVETATAHLAGALGRPTLVPLTEVSWWIWMTDRDDSPWYPTVRLVRQTKRDDWTSVFERIEAEVRAFVAAS